MKQSPNSYLNSRVLKLNVGFLLSAGPGHSHDSELDFPALRIADDLTVAYLRGHLRLSRTKEGILVQTQLTTEVEAECLRCLKPVPNVIELDIEELYASHYLKEAEFFVDEDGKLDLAPLLRAEILIETTHGVLCQDDCKGLCPECGANLNEEPCQCHLDNIDPRLTELKKLLDAN